MNFANISDLDYSLIKEYLDSPTVNMEFESSMMMTLFEHKSYDLIEYCLCQAPGRKFVLSYRVRNLILESAHLPLYKYLVEKGLSLNQEIIICAIKADNVETTLWVQSQIGTNNHLIIVEAIGYDSLNIFEKYCLEIMKENLEALEGYFEIAFKKGRLQIVKRLDENINFIKTHPFSESWFRQLISFNHVDLFIWTIERYIELGNNLDISWLMESLIAVENMVLIEWLYDKILKHDLKFDIVNAIQLSVSFQKFKCCKWLFEKVDPKKVNIDRLLVIAERLQFFEMKNRLLDMEWIS